MRLTLLAPLAALVALAATATAQPSTPLHTVRVVNGAANPLWAGQAPGDPTRIYVVEQNQFDVEIWINGVQNPVPFLDLTGTTVNGTGNERGLLGMAFDPDFQNNNWFYLNYTRAGDGATIVARYTALNGDTADPSSGVVILGPITQPQNNHNGGHIAFGPDGKLYVGMGDGGNFNDTGTGHVAGGNAQSGANLLGKLLRINRDGTIPADNPFVGNPAFMDQIWAYGLRNPWRFSFDRDTGDLWIGDVGQDAREEINFRSAASTGGENYGWRCMEGFNCTGLSGCVCNAPALVLPVHDYPHGVGGICSVTGGFRYRGLALPDWEGLYFFADYCAATIWSMAWNGVTATVTNRTAELAPGGGLAINTITSFGETLDGELYIVDRGGEVFLMVPEGPFRGIGSALAGVNGKPALWGIGTLVAGSAGGLHLKNAAPSASAMLFVGITGSAVPFKGGTLVPVPFVLTLPLVTTAAGGISLNWASWPAGLPPGLEVFFQWAIADGTAPQGIALSNALKGTTP